MKKQITVSYSTTITIDVPENITDEMIFDADQSRWQAPKKAQEILTKIQKEAHEQIEWRDGEITDIHEEMPDCDSSDTLATMGIFVK